MLSRENMISLLGAASAAVVTGLGLASAEGTLAAQVLTNVGFNLSSSVIQGGFSNLRRLWLTSADGLLNHDIQKALARAVARALESLERKYFETEAARRLADYERASIRELFRELKSNVEETLSASVQNITLNEGLKAKLFRMEGANDGEVWDALVGDEALAPYGTNFRDFIRANLVPETMLWFAEELKSDNRENNRAWRAFQRLLLEGIYADVKAVRVGQAEMAADLHKLDELRERIERLQGTVERTSNEPFQLEMERAASAIRKSLEEIAEISRRIDENVVILGDKVDHIIDHLPSLPPPPAAPEALSRELSQFRQRMLGARTVFEMKQVYFGVEGFLAKNPGHPEALHLKDQLQTAMRHPTLGGESVSLKFKRSRTPVFIAVAAALLLLLLGALIYFWLR